MTSLREIQEYFQAYMLNKDDDRILPHISNMSAPAKDRLDIYRNGYYLRLLEVVDKDFPCLKTICGEELLHEWGREYIQAYPSDHYSVCYFNRNFTQFLRETKREAFYAEVAEFEWALTRVLDAADAKPITMQDLAAIPGDSWPYLQFGLHPSIEIHDFHYNVAQICYAIMFEEELPERIYSEKSIPWMIWRFDCNSYFESVNEQQLYMLHAIQQRRNFSEICEGLCQWFTEEEVAQFAVGTLQFWIQKEIIAEAYVQPSVSTSTETEQEEVSLS